MNLGQSATQSPYAAGGAVDEDEDEDEGPRGSKLTLSVIDVRMAKALGLTPAQYAKFIYGHCK
jgi:hypothetical protein